MSTTIETFETLPGQEVPVAKVPRTIAALWEGEPGAPGKSAPSEFRASQMNLILHIGLHSNAADAAAQFSAALRFAQRYPCRILVLVPVPDSEASSGLRTKVFSQCYVGKSRTEMSCCEAVILAYPESTRAYVADQVSTLVEADLPIYYWAHAFASCEKIASYRYLLQSAKRFIFDSAVAPADATTFPWGKSANAIRDLAYARLLPLRQTVGQFLSGFPPEKIAGGLTKVTVQHGQKFQAESARLVDWLRNALGNCSGAQAIAFSVEPLAGAKPSDLSIQFTYADPSKQFSLRADLASGQSVIVANFGSGTLTSPVNISPLSEEAVLAEALFF